MIIEDSLMFFYPFPLVFYVDPEKVNLVKRLSKVLENLEKEKVLDSIFDTYYKSIVEDLKLKQRQVITLENPLIPEDFSGLKPDLGEL